ncbi:MAG: N-acetylglucosamine-6-phosphate deacetylase [Chloroflexi bacterium]|nr:N-acetylglucosamine-6-phosphate deacetylase [Chloroflexota bacterium]
MLYINHASIQLPYQQINDGALLIENGQIIAVGTSDEISSPPAAQIIDATGLMLVPGFIDLQLNGAFGHDFTTDPTTIWEVGEKLPQYGVTSFLPTIVTSPLETITTAQAVLANGPPANYRGATPLGLHIEGPFLNLQKKGAHNPSYLQIPNQDIIQNWSLKQGIRLVTLAPELSGALNLVEILTERGIVVGAGHSIASYCEARAGIGAGIRYGTHLFNSMPSLHHRDPGLIGALLTEPAAAIGLIVDGVHVHPAMVNLVWQLAGPKRITLVTDAMAALGMPPGQYVLGDFEVEVDASSVRLSDDTLAGSVLSMQTAVSNLMRFTGCTFAEALPTVTSTPATLLGLSEQIGQIEPGLTGDLILLTHNFEISTAIIAGKVVYS